MIGPSQRCLPDKTRHWQETDIHDLGGIRTRSPSKRAAADPLDQGNKQSELLFTPTNRYHFHSCINSTGVRQCCQSYNYKFRQGSNHRPRDKWHEPSKRLRQRCGCRRRLNVMWRLKCWAGGGRSDALRTLSLPLSVSLMQLRIHRASLSCLIKHI